MLKLPNRQNSPPGQWSYRVPETGKLYTCTDEQQLLFELRRHYAQTTYPAPDDLPDRIEAFICAAHPSYCVDSGGATRVPYNPTLASTFHNVLTGTKTLLSWFFTGKQLVPQDVANRRAAVCASCPFNTAIEGCSKCNMGSLRKHTEKIVGKRVTTHHEHLDACRICLCALKAKVWFPLTVLTQHLSAEQQGKLPPHCWIVREQQPTEPMTQS